MKPSNSPTPRSGLTCQVVRLWSALRNEGAPPLRHLQTCEVCRQFTVSTDQLQVELRHAALQSAAIPPQGMERRIMEAIRFSPPPREERSSRRFLSFAVAGGAIAVVWVGLSHFNLTPSSPPPTTVAEYSADVAALVAAVRSLPDNLNQKLTGPTAQLAQDNSLNREVENVYSDARSALDFLALNFLPVSNANEAAGRLLDESLQRI